MQNRRVSFAYPLEEKRSIGDPLEFDKSSDLAVPLPFGDANDTNKTNSGTPKKFTTIRKKVGFVFIYIQSACWFTQPFLSILPNISDFIDLFLCIANESFFIWQLLHASLLWKKA